VPTRQELMDKVDELIKKLEDLKSVVLTADQVTVKEGLSDIDSNLGEITTGYIKLGIGTIGKGFTGLRLGAPAFTYGATDYYLAGVSNDALVFGIRTDGTFDSGV
jgi:hypothetical protein